MDYDKGNIPTVYDEARALAPEVLRQWLDLLSAHIPREQVRRIVDLGCGTGRFTQPLAQHFAAHVIGFDPSQKMLNEARRKLTSDRVIFERASAEALPISDNCIDMIFLSMVFHHFPDPRTVARECRRVLRDGGYLVIRNTTREANVPVRHFFPAMQTLIDSELPKRSDVRSVFEAEGFTPGGHQVVRQIVASSWLEFAQKSSLRADSFLARLSDADYEAGMIELRARAAHSPKSQPVVEDVDLFVFTK
jgi:ubiquinone/menaquinone biosynthesis C-methylase UbiE